MIRVAAVGGANGLQQLGPGVHDQRFARRWTACSGGTFTPLMRFLLEKQCCVMRFLLEKQCCAPNADPLEVFLMIELPNRRHLACIAMVMFLSRRF